MADPLLAVEDLHAYYGGAHIVQGVSFAIDREPVAVIGRNGMGKTTLCNALTGLVGAEPGGRIEGSARLAGAELVGRSVHRIAAQGIAYVPQGRRIFSSLTAEEHLRMAGKRQGAWTPERVYELFPRLAERRRVGGAQLSGGEQQMLAIGRALTCGPRLVIMDEPSEGLAPAIVSELTAALRALAEAGLGLLLVEQNLGVASAVASRLLVMLNGRIEQETTPGELRGDPDARRRWLGVTPRRDGAAERTEVRS